MTSDPVPPSGPSFEYFIAQKSDIAIISLVGSSTKDNAAALEECWQKVQNLNATYFIFNLRDLRDVNEGFFRPFALMLAFARKKGPIRISGLNSQHKEALSSIGLLRNQELSLTLNEAMQSLFPHRKLAL